MLSSADLSRLLQEKDEFQRMQLNPQQELEQLTSCTLSGLAQCTPLSQCSYSTQCPVPDCCSAPMVPVCRPARVTGPSLSCSLPCTPGPHSLFAADTLTANKPTVLNTPLPTCTEAPGQHTCARGQCKPRWCVHSHAFMCMLHHSVPFPYLENPYKQRLSPWKQQ